MRHEIAASNFLVTLAQDGYWTKCVMFSGQLSVTSRPAFFREMWMVVCSCTGKQSTDIDWWQCRATTNNGVQMVLEGHRFAPCLSCSPWTWIFVSIAEMVAVPCVSISLCEHIRWCITFWQTTFQKAALRHVVSHPLWVCWLTQLSTQICNVQIFGEAVYYFST